MDDQTEVPETEEKAEPMFRVKYSDPELPGPSYTRPLNHKAAHERKKLIEQVAGITAVVVPETYIQTETAGRYQIEEEPQEGDPARMMREAQTYRAAQQEQVQEDVDAALDEPVGGEHAPMDPESCGESYDYRAHQAAHSALESAIKLAEINAWSLEETLEAAERLRDFLLNLGKS